MNSLKNRLDKFKVANIAKELNIPEQTIYNWLKEDDTDRKKFLKLLIYLEIDLYEYANEQEQ